MKKAFLMIIAVAAFATSADADFINGNFGGLTLMGSSGGDTLSLSNPVLTAFAYSDFAGGTLTVNVPTISGLSTGTTPSTPDFFTITTPTDVYQFNLSTISVTTPGGFYNYYATGTTVDTSATNPQTDTPTIVTIASTGDGSTVYTIDVSTVPEPSTWALMLAGLTTLAFISRRQLRA